MGAKRSAEMKFALALYKGGWNAHAAAKEAGVLPSSFYRLLKEERDERLRLEVARKGSPKA